MTDCPPVARKRDRKRLWCRSTARSYLTGGWGNRLGRPRLQPSRSVSLRKRPRRPTAVYSFG